jgi:predicted transcriptional regulator
MARLTINLSDERQLALKQAAAERGKTMGEIIEESLEQYGVKTRVEAAALIAIARERAGLEEEQAMQLGLEASRAARHESN